MSDNMVEEELGAGLNGIVESGHCFGPFGEVVNCNDNILMFVAKGGETFHEFNAPFAKWANSNDRVEGSEWRSCFGGIYLEIGAVFNYKNAITKEGGPKVASVDYLLGNGHIKEVGSTSTCVVIIEYVFGLGMSEETTEKGVYSSLV